MTDAACLLSALLLKDLAVQILRLLLKVAALSHVLSMARLREIWNARNGSLFIYRMLTFA